MALTRTPCAGANGQPVNCAVSRWVFDVKSSGTRGLPRRRVADEMIRMSETAQQAPAGAVGERHVVRIDDLAFGGEGVGRVNGRVLFVPWVIAGEWVEVEITEVRKNYARARLLRVVEPSAHRVAPRCPYFGRCGGCQYQHLAYAQQVEVKRKQVADLFVRLGKFPARVVAPAVPCPQPYGYRNRIMIRSQWNKPEQKLNLGFVRGDSRLVEDIETCAIAEPALNEQISRVRAHPPPRGGLKVVLRVIPEGWEVPPDSFFQNNRFLLPELVATARAALVAGGTRFLVDAYCGVGFFALELADAVERYVGIEYDQRAIAAARRNAAARQRTNGAFLAGRTEDSLQAAVRDFSPGRTTLLLDPPRKGCSHDSLALLRALRPAQILYVSCHPATLARDLNGLCAGGLFELHRLTPLDMFPQTQHVECVADVRRAG
ncbi:MAG: class I SAM-dependent RNA methyltransferase [Verrucomicrobia bacterium]|nr:class I SAM-dependent RNA methyltransferase [Verrucomicrobiota bacterium]